MTRSIRCADLRFLNSYAETSYNSGDYDQGKGADARRGAVTAPGADRERPGRARRGRAISWLSSLCRTVTRRTLSALLAQNLQELPQLRSGHAAAACTSAISRTECSSMEQRDKAGAQTGAGVVAAPCAARALGRTIRGLPRSKITLAITDYSGAGIWRRSNVGNRYCPAYRRYFGEQHPEYLFGAAELRTDRAGARQLCRGRELFLQSLAIDRKDKAADHDDFAYSLNSLALAEIGLGQIRKPRSTWMKALSSRASTAIGCVRHSS